MPLAELDGWEVRHEFFGLPEDDPAALASFLSKVGVWSTDPEEAALDARRYPCYLHLDDVWQFRTDLRDALTHTHRQSFLMSVAPKLPKPKTLADLECEPYSWVNNFPLRFELSDVAAGVVTITNARRMLFATVLADVASSIRFKICKRRDCQRPFAVTSKHERDYHPECAHVVAQRAYLKREEAKKKAQKRKSLC